MSKPWSLRPGSIHLGTEPSPSAGEVRPDTAFRILLLGNFSGSVGGTPGLRPGWRTLLIDRDNFDEVLARVGPGLRLPPGTVGPEELVVRFSELDDFHPDRLYQRLAPFGHLRELRRRLQNPDTFAQAAEEVRGWASPETSPAQPVPAGQPKAPEKLVELSTEALLEKMLEAAPASEPGRPGMPDAGWQDFLRKLVAPHRAQAPAPDEGRLVELVDQAAGAQLRGLLHHPDFQSLESAWRGVFFLTRRLDTDENLKLYLLDVSKTELTTDLARDDLGASELHRLLVEETVGTPGAAPWSVLAGLYTFGRGPEDVETLARLAHLARRAGAPFLASTDCSLLNCGSLAETPDSRDWNVPAGPEEEEAWAALRQLPEAAYLGLALPRFLLRLPYGKEYSPAEEFAFEELPEGPGHQDYLWGNPAIACACLLGQTFNRHGWALRPGSVLDIDGLPLHVYQEGGERLLKPCAEVVLRERAIEAILERGLMPLLTIQGTDRVRLARFQSLASPPGPLCGRWI
jgi:type VI secretion system protein ImpC